ncbi:SLATT domain-containing protein [Sphingobium sp. SA2]|uniref:SLATT domain-containing protein n=1 Tax=Sphingobium sp. SA2 TaxID=1524832 RepID=UPI0028C17700|nr:SLATT domain-containing protein [Sphingobium sp. SA2]MDT7536077.1 SLATT domain-containing protein [Sphingobium sp. SA2]
MTTHPRTEKIYITYKTRMTTEARLRLTGKVSHLLLSWYSFWIIAISVIELSGKYTFANSQVVVTAMSVLIFGLSLFIYGERYDDKANQFRNCYLDLQELYESSLDENAKMEQYAKILRIYENQSDRDYDNMLFDARIRGQSLNNAQGKLSITNEMFVILLVKRLSVLIAVTLLFIAPPWIIVTFINVVSQAG